MPRPAPSPDSSPPNPAIFDASTPSSPPSNRPQEVPLVVPVVPSTETPLSERRHDVATESETGRSNVLWEAPELGPHTATSASSTPHLRDSATAGPSSRARHPGTHTHHDDDSESSESDIEMEPILGHRRRRSSLMNPVNTQSGPSSRGAGSNRSPTATGLSEAATPGKILEDGELDDRSDEGNFSDEDLHDDEETGLTKSHKKRLQKKKRTNTRLDQRFVPEKENSISADERKEADKSVARSLAINVFLILLWYLFSLSISLYNKWMFDPKKLDFHFPLFTTSLHMVVQFALSSLVLWLIPSFRPNHKRSRHGEEAASPMSAMFYLTRIGPCGAATGLDIGLGNTSLKFISLTFYTMCKSSSLAFVLIFAFLFRLEKPTWKLVGIIATMTVGVVLMVFGEVEFKLGGFALVISAAFFSGFRWALTQILLLRNPATSNPFSSIFYLSPVMFIAIVVIAIPVEGFGPLFEGFRGLADEWGVLLAPLIMLFPGCIAFCMTASEFALLKRTSVVTLSIAGIFKEVVTIFAATLVFHDHLTLVNLVGLLTTMAAIVAYNYIKITKMREEAQVDAHNRHVADEDPISSGSDYDPDAEDVQPGSSAFLRDSIDEMDPLAATDGDNQPLLPSDSPQEHRPTRSD